MKHAFCLPVPQPLAGVPIKFSMLLQGLRLPWFTWGWSIVPFRARFCMPLSRLVWRRTCIGFATTFPFCVLLRMVSIVMVIIKSLKEEESGSKLVKNSLSEAHEPFPGELTLCSIKCCKHAGCTDKNHMALCSPSRWLSNNLVLEANATFITCRSWPLWWFVAHLGQSRREWGRFSPSFQRNTFILQVRIYTQLYTAFFFFFVSTINQVTC